jgi:hypothetical protein
MIAGNKPTNAISVKRHSGALGSPIDPEPKLMSDSGGPRWASVKSISAAGDFARSSTRIFATVQSPYDAAANALMAEVSQFT